MEEQADLASPTSNASFMNGEFIPPDGNLLDQPPFREVIDETLSHSQHTTDGDRDAARTALLHVVEKAYRREDSLVSKKSVSDHELYLEAKRAAQERAGSMTLTGIQTKLVLPILEKLQAFPSWMPYLYSQFLRSYRQINGQPSTIRRGPFPAVLSYEAWLANRNTINSNGHKKRENTVALTGSERKGNEPRPKGIVTALSLERPELLPDQMRRAMNEEARQFIQSARDDKTAGKTIAQPDNPNIVYLYGPVMTPDRNFYDQAPFTQIVAELSALSGITDKTVLRNLISVVVKNGYPEWRQLQRGEINERQLIDTLQDEMRTDLMQMSLEGKGTLLLDRLINYMTTFKDSVEYVYNEGSMDEPFNYRLDGSPRPVYNKEVTIFAKSYAQWVSEKPLEGLKELLARLRPAERM